MVPVSVHDWPSGEGAGSASMVVIVPRATLTGPTRPFICGRTALVAARSTAQSEGMNNDNSDILFLLEQAIATVGPEVASVGASDHGRSTPCKDFNLGTLVAHLIGGMRGFADVGEGKPLNFDADPDVTKDVLAHEFHEAADRLVAAFRAPGILDRTFEMPWGPTTGMQLIGFELIELVVHGWDICRSLDQPATFSNDIVTAALTGARMWVDESVRTPQLFGPEVPVAEEAPILDRLVGFLGRNPRWAHTALTA